MPWGHAATATLYPRLYCTHYQVMELGPIGQMRPVESWESQASVKVTLGARGQVRTSVQITVFACLDPLHTFCESWSSYSSLDFREINFLLLAHRWRHMVFAFLSLIYFTFHNIRQFHPRYAEDRISFFSFFFLMAE